MSMVFTRLAVYQIGVYRVRCLLDVMFTRLRQKVIRKGSLGSHGALGILGSHGALGSYGVLGSLRSHGTLGPLVSLVPLVPMVSVVSVW